MLKLDEMIKCLSVQALAERQNLRESREKLNGAIKRCESQGRSFLDDEYCVHQDEYVRKADEFLRHIEYAMEHLLKAKEAMDYGKK